MTERSVQHSQGIGETDGGLTEETGPTTTWNVEEELQACRNAVVLNDRTMRDLLLLNEVILSEEGNALNLGETVARALDHYRKYVPFS
jgi:hypothetical protein